MPKSRFAVRFTAIGLVGVFLLSFALPSLSGLGPHTASAAEGILDARSRRIVHAVNESVDTAGREYQKGDYAASGQAVSRAIEQIEVAVKAGTPELYDALMPAMKRVVNARVLLELEGVAIAPFRRPERPDPAGQANSSDDAQMSDDAKMAANPFPGLKRDPASPTQPGGTPPPGGLNLNTGVSFVGQVAPILASKCGGCHVRGSKGGFSLATFAALMKGPPEGVVIFPGDSVGSRLIETIVTGDMPRGGSKVSPQELAMLKQWIVEGAKFDGNDPGASIMQLTSATAAPKPQPAKMAMPTGKETVQFASHIAPILVDNCGGCHINAMRTQGGLSMDTLARMFRGGDSGPVVQPGSGEASLLVRRLRGMDGDRMPGGGRPALSEDQISLIAKWIDEGATAPPDMAETPVGIVTQQAWLAAASPEEVTGRRGEMIQEHFALAGGGSARSQKMQTGHFAITGDVSEKTLEMVGEQAEAALRNAARVLPGSNLAGTPPESETFFNGLASIYVLPRRYDYSEFAKMVEGRGIPPEWNSHWRYNGIEAYVAVVASDRDEPEVIAERLAGPIASLAVASRGAGVPRWFADGLGQVVAASDKKVARSELAKRRSELITAVGSLKYGKDFMAGKLPPERADRIAAAVCESLLSSDKKRGFDTVMRNLDQGKPFPTAFQAGIGMTPEVYFDAWLAWVK